MEQERYTKVSISDGSKTYTFNVTGFADGETKDDKFACVCTDNKPDLSERKGGRWVPQYTITGLSPSGRRVVLNARCTYNAAGGFVKNQTICDFKLL